MSKETNGRHYKVSASELVRQRLADAQAQAVAAGTGNQFFAAWQAIWSQLRTRPWEFGEPRYRLASLKLQVRHGGVRPVIVSYAVHEDLPLVIIMSFWIAS